MNYNRNYDAVKPPKGIQSADELKRLQGMLGVNPANGWDAAAQGAYDKYLEGLKKSNTSYLVFGYSALAGVNSKSRVKLMQQALGDVQEDGVWGPETNGSYIRRMALEKGETQGKKPSVDTVGYGGYTEYNTDMKKTAYQSVAAPTRVTVPARESAPLSNASTPLRNVSGYAASDTAYTQDAYYGPRKIVPAESPKEEETPAPSAPAFGRRVRRAEPKYSNSGPYEPYTMYKEHDTALQRACVELNRKTAMLAKETCCNLYSAVIDGKRKYFTGEIFVGDVGNVVPQYLTMARWEQSDVKSRFWEYPLLRYEGFVHSHPMNRYSEGFSHGDAHVAANNGTIYLTTPRGLVYRLDGDEAIRNISSRYVQTIPYKNMTSEDTRSWGKTAPEPKNDLEPIVQKVIDIMLAEIYRKQEGMAKDGHYK